MNHVIRTKALAVLSLILAAASFSLVTQAAEKREQTYVKTNYMTGSKTSVMVGDVPNHEVGQELTISDIKYSNPDFKTKVEWVYNQFDYVDGTGPQRGTFIDTHEEGSQTYGTYEGAQKTVVKSDGSWEASWEGKYRYVGGSGKFKNIKGSGIYKGRASSSEPAREEGKETVEY